MRLQQAGKALLSRMDAESDPTVMVPLFGCFQMIATNYAHVFVDFYKDVLDIVCGWRTDVDHAPLTTTLYVPASLSPTLFKIRLLPI